MQAIFAEKSKCQQKVMLILLTSSFLSHFSRMWAILSIDAERIVMMKAAVSICRNNVNSDDDESGGYSVVNTSPQSLARQNQPREIRNHRAHRRPLYSYTTFILLLRDYRDKAPTAHRTATTDDDNLIHDSSAAGVAQHETFLMVAVVADIDGRAITDTRRATRHTLHIVRTRIASTMYSVSPLKNCSLVS